MPSLVIIYTFHNIRIKNPIDLHTQGADGTYGNNTKTAVINFQRAFPACGTPDGYFGKNTLNTFVSKVGSLAGYEPHVHRRVQQGCAGR